MIQTSIQAINRFETPPAKPVERHERDELTAGRDFAEQLRRAGAAGTSRTRAGERGQRARAGAGDRTTERRRKETHGREDDEARATHGPTDHAETAALAGQNGRTERTPARPGGTRDGGGERVTAGGQSQTATTTGQHPEAANEPEGQTAAVAQALAEKAGTAHATAASTDATVDQALKAMVAGARGQTPTATAGPIQTDAPAAGTTPDDQATQGQTGQVETARADLSGPATGGLGRAQGRSTGGADTGGAQAGPDQTGQGPLAGEASASATPTAAMIGLADPAKAGTRTTNLDNQTSQTEQGTMDAGAVGTGPKAHATEARKESEAADGAPGQPAQATAVAPDSRAKTADGPARASLGQTAKVPENGTGRAAEGDATGRPEAREAGEKPAAAETNQSTTVNDLTASQPGRASSPAAQAAKAIEGRTAGSEAGRGEAARPDPADIIRQVVAKTSLRGNGDGGEIKVQLKPEYLGALSLRVALERGGVTAHLVTQSQAVKEALEAGLPQLKQALEGQGLRTDHIAVTLGQDAFSAQSGGQGATAWGRQGWDRRSGWETFSPAAAGRPADGGYAPAHGTAQAATRRAGGHALDYVA